MKYLLQIIFELIESHYSGSTVWNSAEHDLERVDPAAAHDRGAPLDPALQLHSATCMQNLGNEVMKRRSVKRNLVEIESYRKVKINEEGGSKEC